MCALTIDRQPFTMPDAAVAPEVHQPLNIHRNFATKFTFDEIIVIDRLANSNDFIIGKLVYPTFVRNAAFAADFDRLRPADPMDVRQSNGNTLPSWNVYACNTRHAEYSLRLPVRYRPRFRFIHH
tara:strand:- start:94 stop:468 length:375 start_codon:yes stop_codon:yes gene_type:complete